MQINLHELLFIFGMGSMAASLFFTLLMFLMYPITPKKVIEKYFRPPYFSEAFVTFYSGFPTAMYRGMIFMRLAAFPNSGKKRNLTNIHKEFPNWYINLSKILLIAFFVSFTFLAISMIAFAIVFGI